MDKTSYKIALKNMLQRGGYSMLLNYFNKDIYADLPTISIDGKNFERYKNLYSFILFNINLACEVSDNNDNLELMLVKTSIEKLNQYGLDIHLTPDMSDTVQKNLIEKLDNEKILFSQTLKESINIFHNKKESLMLILAFARLCYRFNEYQAPLRISAEMAMKDAMGLTDHYQELIDSLYKELKLSQ
jgi:hypothetical protein